MHPRTLSLLLNTPLARGGFKTAHDSGPKEKHRAEIIAEVEELKFRHINKAGKSTADAFEDDPFINYMEDTPDAKPPPTRIYKVAYTFMFAHFIRRKLTYTINGGDASIIASRAPETEGKPGPVDNISETFISILVKALQTISSPEQKKRRKEVDAKLKVLLEKFVKDRAEKMFYVDMLATAPACQGRGYGGMLIETVTRQADEQGRATWLLSSNINNTAFYNSHGFVAVGYLELGRDNPTWNKPPVISPLMIREPKAMVEAKKKVLG
ncbi:hypothetical protein BD410DRAFT_481752 [Rickenella mellea]|uniref:N-acetyltransferase domain-containing protein n=1 Tax=Rickenella mellea TaxID=50990 RepID=A0A4Y7QH89_9AGAM|nr:hypothetical protein BD410DRAFT_481752 [Rickenella mellea]